jgi:hypothetical protein
MKDKRKRNKTNTERHNYHIYHIACLQSLNWKLPLNTLYVQANFVWVSLELAMVQCVQETVQWLFQGNAATLA